MGKYFKYPNSNNTSNPSFRWLYHHVKNYEQDSIIVDIFYMDCYGNVQFSLNRKQHGFSYVNSGYIEITKKEYDKVAKNILKKIQKQLKNK